MATPKVIFIDWNGTLSDSFFLEQLKTSEKSEERDLYNEIQESLFKDNKEMINDWMRGKYTSEEIIKYVSEKINVPYDYLFKEFIKGCELMVFCSNRIPEIVKRLRAKGIKVIIATNNMDCFTRWTVPFMKLDSIFDEIINSWDIKALKHDLDKDGNSAFFSAFFLKNKINPRDCIFIDDSEDKKCIISELGINYLQLPQDLKLTDILTNF